MELYVSDLDGTLLGGDERLSSRSVRIINRLIGDGLLFTIATARSFTSAGPIIHELNLSFPMVLFNGVIVFDPVKKENIVCNSLDRAVARGVIDVFETHGISPHVYTLEKDNSQKIFYKGVFNSAEEYFVNSRLQKGDKRFNLVQSVMPSNDADVITVVSIGKKSELYPIYRYLKEHVQVNVHFTEDTYLKGYYWLETAHVNGTKKWGVDFIKNYLGAGRVICFGDNLNDLPMFEYADEKYAVENAYDEVKSNATGVIGSNLKDGVAMFLKERFARDPV